MLSRQAISSYNAASTVTGPYGGSEQGTLDVSNHWKLTKEQLRTRDRVGHGHWHTRGFCANGMQN